MAVKLKEGRDTSLSSFNKYLNLTLSRGGFGFD
jgi:hypothetical protein